jgi:hypothetical protein
LFSPEKGAISISPSAQCSSPWYSSPPHRPGPWFTDFCPIYQMVFPLVTLSLPKEFVLVFVKADMDTIC